MGCDYLLIMLVLLLIGFNSRTPCGVRLPLTFVIRLPTIGFNSRTPCGVRQRIKSKLVRICRFQFTHPVWGATINNQYAKQRSDVSIHAPRVGCDMVQILLTLPIYRFNSRTPCGVRPQGSGVIFSISKVSIHAPRVGCDLEGSIYILIFIQFQFTHPVWGATLVGQ